MTTQRQPTVTELLGDARDAIDAFKQTNNYTSIGRELASLCGAIEALCAAVEQLDANAKRAANYADCTANGITPDW